MALLADTGLRVSEALNIHLGDVDTRARAIAVIGKGEKPRTVFYGEAVAQHLRNYLRRRALDRLQADGGQIHRVQAERRKRLR